MEQQIVNLLLAGDLRAAWLYLGPLISAWLVNFGVRVMKPDTKLPVDLKPEHRPYAAWLLGAVAGVLDLLLTGMSWKHALVTAVVAPLIAQIAHWIGIEKLRGGKELPVPLLMRQAADAAKASSVLFIMLALSVAGCAGSFEETRASARVGAPPPSTRCIELDNRHALAGGIGKGAAVLGGAAGLSTIATDDAGLQTGLAVGSVAAGAVAAGAIFVSEQSAAAWSRECVSP